MILQDLFKLVCFNDIPELVKQKENGVDFTITDTHDQNNMLIAYCGYGWDEKYAKVDMVNFLLECGININDQRNGRGSKISALHMAVANNFSDIVKVLIDKGADIESRDGNGNTPLINIVFAYRGEEEKLEMIRYLINNGANLDTKNDHGVSSRTSIIQCGEGIDEEHNKKEWDLRFLLKETDANKT